MKIGGYQRCSFIDYKHYHSAVIFTSGCNMNCPYCHNQELLNMAVDQKEVFKHLQKRINQLDAVVVSGGEPCLQESLPEFIKAIKGMGYKVKLDTNGTNPEMVKKLIREKLIDYIAMDIKTIPEKYKAICGLDWKDVEESYKIILDFGSYEFRTTLYPEISLDDLAKLISWMENKNYYIQQYRQTENSHLIPYSKEDILKIINQSNVIIRGF